MAQEETHGARRDAWGALEARECEEEAELGGEVGWGCAEEADHACERRAAVGVGVGVGGGRLGKDGEEDGVGVGLDAGGDEVGDEGGGGGEWAEGKVGVELWVGRGRGEEGLGVYGRLFWAWGGSGLWLW